MIETIISAFERFMQWIRGGAKSAPMVEQSVVSQDTTEQSEDNPPELHSVANVQQKRKVRAAPKPKVKEDADTLAYLLDNLDKSFKALSIASEPGFDLSPTSRAGLKRLGPFIPPKSWSRALKQRESHYIDEPSKARFSGLLFIALNEGHRAEKDILRPDFFYAVQESQPPGVQKLPGVGYQCGFAWRSIQRKGRLVWCSFYCAVDRETGLVAVANHISRQRVELPRGSAYTRAVSVAPYIGSSGDPEDKAQDHPLDPAAEFAHYFNIWERRSSLWSVSARRGGRRVTFGIEANAAVSFFKDRGREAVTASGQRKPILHAVAEHTRSNGAFVKAHIRGAEKFHWNSFECAITAPEHHVYDCVAFGVPAMSAEELKNYHGNVVSIHGVAKLFSELEDNNVKKGQRKKLQKQMKQHSRQLINEISQPVEIAIKHSEEEDRQEVKELLQSIARGDSSLVPPESPPSIQTATGEVFTLTETGDVKREPA